jgi:7tm Odorant receptor
MSPRITTVDKIKTFIISKQVKDESDIGRLVSFIFPPTFQILLVCYFANNLTLASEQLSQSLFHSNWIKESKKFKAAMKLFMENSKKPLKISAFGMFHINLENFLRIINSAYSLYAVLKKINSKV